MTADDSGPLAAYRERRQAGRLQPDPAQVLAAEKLQSLHNALKRYRPSMGKATWRERLGLTRRREEPPQGLYIFGSVGRGKSMLMDLFYETAPVATKRRAHFHEFMLDIHDRLHRLRRSSKRSEGDLVATVADEIIDESWLLCFDEFHVTNIADAMLLGRLFEALFDRGVVTVATSNWAPDDLYKDGLQRDRFLPFIDLLKRKLDILELDGEKDYRLARLKGMTVYHHPLGPAAERALDDAFARLADGAPGEPASLTVQGRRLSVPRAANGVARFDFAELCEAPLGAADYLAIAVHYHAVILSGIPKMGPEKRNEARRFMTLVDALYEHNVALICSAADVPDRLHPVGESAFEFRRTVSRLIEMQSADYLARAHLT